jgi:pimeloyl-ACP methyl ester carboxylesterase
MSAGDVLKRAGVVTGVAAGLVGAAYGAERAVVARIRHREDPDSGAALVPAFDETVVVDCDDGTRIRVLSRGEGPPIVLAHGVTLSSRVWAKQFDSLPAAGFRAVAFDSRGHGESTLGEGGHSVANVADDLKQVLQLLDLRGAVLVGHSMGGMAVQAFALAHPEAMRERVRGLVLMSTTARVHGLGTWARRGVRSGAATAPAASALVRQKNLGFLVARVGFGDDPHPSHVELTRQMLAACSRETLRDAVHSLLDFDVTAELGRLAVPTLVIAGTNDAVTPIGDSREIAELVPGARLEELPGAGHMLMLERADEVDKLIVDFADACRA